LTSDIDFNSIIDPANQALEFYKVQLQSYRRAVDTWTLVDIRNKIVKDIRNMIAKMIWNAREEAEYELDLDEYCNCLFCAADIE
jgi:hypothetical protein